MLMIEGAPQNTQPLWFRRKLGGDVPDGRRRHGPGRGAQGGAR